jgi:hypothetical protein
VTSLKDSVASAIGAFDMALPHLRVMRNVGEHADAYAVDHTNRHHRDVDRTQLAVGTWDGTTYRWLDRELNVEAAMAASDTLHRTLRGILK